MKALCLMIFCMLSSLSFAQDIFVIKKNKTPKNELHYKVNVEGCKLKTPAVIGYWVMGEEDGHTEDLTAAERGIYKPRISYQKEKEADFSIGAMDRMGSQLPDKQIRVVLENCKAKAYLEIQGREIHLTEIYVQIKFITVQYMILSGFAPNGEKVSHRIDL